MASQNTAPAGAVGTYFPDDKCRHCGREVVTKHGVTYFECNPPSNTDISACEKLYPTYNLCKGGGKGPVIPVGKRLSVQ